VVLAVLRQTRGEVCYRIRSQDDELDVRVARESELSTAAPMAKPKQPPLIMRANSGTRHRVKSQIGKRSLKINGHPTSVSLEDDFWNALREIAAAQDTTAQGLVLKINKERTDNNLSSAVRLHILSYYRERDAKA
jgi:predicted DNA-binding ribbon-helix-helix protein